MLTPEELVEIESWRQPQLYQRHKKAFSKLAREAFRLMSQSVDLPFLPQPLPHERAQLEDFLKGHWASFLDKELKESRFWKRYRARKLRGKSEPKAERFRGLFAKYIVQQNWSRIAPDSLR